LTPHKHAQNVLREPANAKFRRVRAGNEAFKTAVVACKGGEDYLRAAGWRDATIDFARHLVLADALFNDECVGGVALHSFSLLGRPERTQPRPLRADWLRQDSAPRGAAAAEGAGGGGGEGGGARASVHTHARIAHGLAAGADAPAVRSGTSASSGWPRTSRSCGGSRR
jgi:hypothetical protein